MTKVGLKRGFFNAFHLCPTFSEPIQGLNDQRVRVYKLVNVTFKKPYDHIPNVKVGVEEYVEWDGYPVIRYGAAVTKVWLGFF